MIETPWGPSTAMQIPAGCPWVQVCAAGGVPFFWMLRDVTHASHTRSLSQQGAGPTGHHALSLAD